MSFHVSSEARTNPAAELEWHDVCAVDDVVPATGAAALLAGEQIAIVRTIDDRWFAISNFDPFSHAFVLARGIVGDRGGVPKIASPIYKQNFNLETGECFDDPKVRLPVYPLRLNGPRVEVALARRRAR